VANGDRKNSVTNSPLGISDIIHTQSHSGTQNMLTINFRN